MKTLKVLLSEKANFHKVDLDLINSHIDFLSEEIRSSNIKILRYSISQRPQKTYQSRIIYIRKGIKKLIQHSSKSLFFLLSKHQNHFKKYGADYELS